MATAEIKLTPSRFLSLLLVAAALICGGIFIDLNFRHDRPAAQSDASNWTLRGGRSETGIHEPAAIQIPTPPADLPSVRGRQLRDAIKAHDFDKALAISSQMLSSSRAKIWTFYPFQDFVASLPDLAYPAFERDLNAFVDRAPLNPLPRLLRAQYYYDLAWRTRGDRFVNETDNGSLSAFSYLLRKGLADVDTVLTLDPTVALRPPAARQAAS